MDNEFTEINDFQKMIREICDEHNIKMSVISRDWIIMLEKDGITRFIVGCRFDSNKHGLGMVLDDKFATYEALSHLNIPIAYHEILYSEKNKAKHAKGANKIENAYDFFEKYNHNIVIKVNDGSQGKNCFHITSKRSIKRTVNKLFTKHYSLSLCPYYEIKNEYRIIMLDGEVQIMYQKIRPSVTGDGIHTIKELLLNLNEHYFIKKLRSKKYDRVLPKGETFEYNWQFNLSHGAVVNENIDPSLKDKLLSIASDVSNKLGINFVSVDIIDTTEGLMVLEINSGVATGHYRKLKEDGPEIAKKMYEKAILKMFL